MRNMNCRNVRREIEGAETGHPLSGSAQSHIASCGNCATLSREQSKLQQIVASLGTVEAPGDFDFRLRARLAGESRNAARPYSMRDFPFSLRAAAVATVLLVIGAAFVFVTMKTRPGDALPTQVAVNRVNPAPGSTSTTAGLQPGVTPTREASQGDDGVKAGLKPVYHQQPNRRSLRSETAAFRGNNQTGTRELGSSQAPVVNAFDEGTESYPTAAFPINASYQSLKVSVDDGRGASRTISLPTVSFGSQRALSQSASPLMASSRGVW